MQGEVIDDEQVRGEIASEDLLEAVVGTGLAQLAQEDVGATVGARRA